MAIYGGLAFTILLSDMKQLGTVAPASLAGGGLLNLLHIATSYKAFADLPAGNAMAIFYAYPVWNLLGAWLLLGEEIPVTSMPWVGLALIGMIFVAQPDLGAFSSLTVEKPFATLCAVLSGMTESAIYFFFKMMKKEEGTFKGMFELYGGSFAWMLPVILAGSFGGGTSGTKSILPKIDFSWKVWMPMLLFNVFVGFTGYAMRFAAIPMVSTLIFSSLNFVGIVAAYIFGYLFQGEKPSWSAVAGAAAIIVANGVLLSRA
jgi:drug/metabolite transporter (DMT)-like permease